MVKFCFKYNVDMITILSVQDNNIIYLLVIKYEIRENLRTVTIIKLQENLNLFNKEGLSIPLFQVPGNSPSRFFTLRRFTKAVLKLFKSGLCLQF